MTKLNMKVRNKLQEESFLGSTYALTKLRAKYLFCIWFCFSLQTASIWAQNANGVYDNETLHPGIYTAQLYKGDNELLYPVIDLNASEYLTLEFDLLSDQAEDFYVTLLHCNQDWRLSEMQPIEYYEGYSYERMLNYKPAQGTSINFLHYSHRIPFGGSCTELGI